MIRLNITKEIVCYGCLFLMVIVFTGCANVVSIKDCVVDEPYGFWGGLWHGFIAPVSFLLA